MSQTFLCADSLSFERDYRTLFSELSFTLSGGQVIQVAGQNGVGKTSLLRGLCGLNDGLRGPYEWFGSAWPECRYELAKHTLFMGHLSGVKAVLTPRENLKAYFDLRNHISLDAIDAALDKVGLYGYESTPAFQLSAGQQRRIALARLHLSQAKVWVLDEPFTAIDKHGVAELEQQISEFAAAGGGVLLTSHHSLAAMPNLTVLDLEQYRVG